MLVVGSSIIALASVPRGKARHKFSVCENKAQNLMMLKAFREKCY